MATQEGINIFLTRHGQKQDSAAGDLSLRSPVCLTKLGITQVENLSVYLLQTHPELRELEKLYSSPIARTIQTAEILRSRLAIGEISLEPALEEISISGDESVPQKEQKEILRHCLLDNNYVPPNHISIRTRLDEVLSFFKTRIAEGDKNLLVSSHGVLIRSIVYSLFPENKPSSTNILNSNIPNSSLTIINFDGQRFNLKCFGSIKHLD